MNGVFAKTTRAARLQIERSMRRRVVAVRTHRRHGRLFDILEDRTVLSPINNVSNLQGLAITAAQNVQTTQDVATFTDTDSTAVPADFTATITWPGGTKIAGIITEDASNVFHVTGTHTFTTAGLGQAITVTIKDSNGTLYATGAFNQTNLVSSVAGTAGVTDSSLINPWGMSSSATSPIWVSDQGSGLSTLYNPNGNPIKQALTVTIPASGPPSGPTGQVFNNDATTTDFTLPKAGGGTVPSDFIFDTLGGTIDGWNPGSTGGASTALTAATVTGAAFTGLAQASVTSGSTTNFYLYAADFTGTTGSGGIDVFDHTFTNVSGSTFTGKFVDPNAVAGYEPYNITLLKGDLYVAYAQPSGIVTTGGGYIDEFDTAGNFINRIFTDTAGTNIKGPWGMAIAPAGFGSFAGDLLVGNFGDSTGTAPNGSISAITLPTTTGSPGTLAGTLSTPNGTLTNPGLWGLIDGNGGSGGSTGTLYFSAGIDSQTEGLFGSIAFASAASASVAAPTPSATPLTIDSVSNLKGLAVTAVQDVQTTQDVATFTDVDASATPSNFTASITWPDGSSTAGIITEDASNVFHVTGTHTFTTGGLGQAITVTIKDSNGTLYETGAFNQTNVVSSVAGTAGVTDPSLINPWGMSSSATSPIWVSDQGSGLSTLYNPNGNPVKVALTVTIPAIGTPSGPTGQVFNADTTGFNLPTSGGGTVSSLFIFDTLGGTIAGWNPGSTAGMNLALTAATVTGASFTGLAQASVTSGSTTNFYLYAADFTGTTGASGIDVFNAAFTNVSGTTFAGKFVDPNAVAGYHPYNVALLNGDLYVAYAQPSGIVTTGGGYIDEFDTSGNFINRIFTDTAGTNIKGPWGMAIAPAGFGSFGGDLLVGNFGAATGTAPNGTIVAITLPTTPGTPGTLAGTLSTPNGTLTNPGLWGLTSGGNGGSGGSTNTLYFTAGIDSQTQGLFGAIAFASAASASTSAPPLTPPRARQSAESREIRSRRRPRMCWLPLSWTPAFQARRPRIPRRSTGGTVKRPPRHGSPPKALATAWSSAFSVTTLTPMWGLLGPPSRSLTRRMAL